MRRARRLRGVKTVEGFRRRGCGIGFGFPSEATAEAPAKLVIWLHPSGGSMNEMEKMAPEFAAHGLRTMVFSPKQFFGWETEENPMRW